MINDFVISNNETIQKVFFVSCLFTFGAFHSYFFFVFNRLFLSSFHNSSPTKSSSTTETSNDSPTSNTNNGDGSDPQLDFDNSISSEFDLVQKIGKFSENVEINKIFYFNLINSSLIGAHNDKIKGINNTQDLKKLSTLFLNKTWHYLITSHIYLVMNISMRRLHLHIGNTCLILFH